MPFDVAATSGVPRSRLPSQMPSLNQTEREATAHFARQLCIDLANHAEMSGKAVLLVRLAEDLQDATVRLASADSMLEALAVGEIALVQLSEDLLAPGARRQALAVRLASVAAAAWRQHCQIQRLGFCAAK